MRVTIAQIGQHVSRGDRAFPENFGELWIFACLPLWMSSLWVLMNLMQRVHRKPFSCFSDARTLSWRGGGQRSTGGLDAARGFGRLRGTFCCDPWNPGRWFCIGVRTRLWARRVLIFGFWPARGRGLTGIWLGALFTCGYWYRRTCGNYRDHLHRWVWCTCRNKLVITELDMPEVALVAILDANEGFLRSDRSLIQNHGTSSAEWEWESYPICRSNYRFQPQRCNGWNW